MAKKKEKIRKKTVNKLCAWIEDKFKDLQSVEVARRMMVRRSLYNHIKNSPAYMLTGWRQFQMKHLFSIPDEVFYELIKCPEKDAQKLSKGYSLEPEPAHRKLEPTLVN